MTHRLGAERSVTSDHFHDLDGVRGLLAIVVMLFHYGLNTVIGRFTGVYNTTWDICVDFFFVLSGLVIARSVTAKRIDVWRFTVKRFFRLFPLHLAISSLFAPVLIFGGGVGPIDLVLDLTATAPLALRDIQNYPAWSLSFEFYGPVFFVFLISYKMPGRRVAFALAVLCVLILLPTLHQTLTRQETLFGPYLDYVRAFCGIGLGFTLWLFVRDCGVDVPAGLCRVIFPIAVICFFLVAISSAVKPMIAFTMPFVFVVAMFSGMGSRTIFSSRPFRWAGQLSFGIYMVHVPVLLAFLAVFGSQTLDANIPLKGAMVIISLAMAWLLNCVVERPGMQMRSR